MNLLEELEADFSVFFNNTETNYFIWNDISPRLNFINNLCTKQKQNRELLKKHWDEIYEFALREESEDITGEINDIMPIIEKIDVTMKKILELPQFEYDKLFEVFNSKEIFEKFRADIKNLHYAENSFKKELSAIGHNISELISLANQEKFIDQKILEIHKNSLSKFKVPKTGTQQQRKSLKQIGLLKDSLVSNIRNLINLDSTDYDNLFSHTNEIFSEEKTLNNIDKYISQDNCIFIGHGRNLLWTRIALYIIDKLKIQPIYYESESRVGNYVNQEIETFVNNPNIKLAIITMMKEDELKSGEFYPRQNTVDEAARFSQKLGKDKVAIIVEEGVTIPSNLQGIDIVKYDNNIDAIFHKINEFCKREKLPIA